MVGNSNFDFFQRKFSNLFTFFQKLESFCNKKPERLKSYKRLKKKKNQTIESSVFKCLLMRASASSSAVIRLFLFVFNPLASESAKKRS